MCHIRDRKGRETLLKIHAPSAIGYKNQAEGEFYNLLNSTF